MPKLFKGKFPLQFSPVLFKAFLKGFLSFLKALFKGFLSFLKACVKGVLSFFKGLSSPVFS